MTKKKPRMSQSEIPAVTLRTGLAEPPLTMVLVHAENERANAALGPSAHKQKAGLESEETVLKIIEHLEKGH